MKRIDEILLDWVSAFGQLEDIVSEKAKGDWDKLDLLLANDEKSRECYRKMRACLAEFRDETSLGKIFSYAEDLGKIANAMERIVSRFDDSDPIEEWLVQARDMLEDSLSDGRDDRRVKAIDILTKLPRYRPNDWVKRQYTTKGIYLSPEANKIPLYLIQRFEEACHCYIYGNFMASVALARAVAEIALKDRFPKLKKCRSFEQIVNKEWPETEGLREHDELRERVNRIRELGNEILHHQESKVLQICNELLARTILEDLKLLLESLY